MFETAILPVSAQLLGVEKNLDYPQFPDNTPEKVQDLVDNLQSIRLRLQSLETAFDKAIGESPELMQALAPLSEKWRQRVQGLFERWSWIMGSNYWSNETTFSCRKTLYMGKYCARKTNCRC